MNANRQDMLNFHLTGRRGAAAGVPGGDSCPALLVPYRDLCALRYDFPLILLDGADPGAFVDSLTGVVNRLLREIAPEGSAGSQLRRHVLRLETRMRGLAASRPGNSLGELWQQAEESLLAECGVTEAESLGNSFSTARFALRAKGTVVDCDDRLPACLLEHAWRKIESRRSRDSLERIGKLVVGLRDMLKVDDLKNGKSRTPQKLRMTFGQRYREAFDFEMMSGILEGTALRNPLPPARRKRIRDALAVLEAQRFFVPSGAAPGHRFVFDGLAAALKAWDARLDEIADVVRAIEIAELEIENSYDDNEHSAYFERFGARALAPEDLAMFPSYLVCVHESECNTRDTARLLEIVSRELPMSILVQAGDALGEPSPVDGVPHRGSWVQQLARTFVAGDAFVLQAAASNLYRLSEPLRRGLEYGGPSVFSVYVPRTDPAAVLPAYLQSAAATESRAFPSFSYDPAAGKGLADRFGLDGNPEAESDWPCRELRYEDHELQTVAEDYRFTLADFAVTDPRYADHFAVVAKEDWNDHMVPLADYLELTAAEAVERLPYVSVVDSGDCLRRMIVDDTLLRIVWRCRERWHSLQELGGVHNSWAAAARAEAAQARSDTTPEAPAVEATVAAAPAEATPEPAKAPEEPETAAENDGEPWIETPRCTTCDECTTRNPRMFAYDDNKQAYISDPDAGTFLDLVEAAEICQVSIIHPGKPRNPDESGLADLIERAAPFNG